MVLTRNQIWAEASKTTGGILNYLVPVEKSIKGNEKKHFVYYAGGNTLVLVHIGKNTWGLILIDKDGKVRQGQYVKAHRMYPKRCRFDGKHFYWFACIGKQFARGKSVAPYFTAIEPVVWSNGWTITEWPGFSGAHEATHDLSSIRFTRLKPPYPGVNRESP